MSKNLPMLTPEIQEAFPPAVLEVIRTSLCPTATDSEFMLFAHKAASYGLDPFKNEIFFIKYGQQARIQFAAEAYLSKAREKEGFQPPDTQMVCENDDFRIARNPETKEMEVIKHETGFPRGKIIGAYSIAYRDGYRPVTVIIDRSEIEHMFSGQNKDNWNKWTTDMFGKFVEQRALKKQYGLEFGDDDIPQPHDIGPDPYVRKDITEEVNAAGGKSEEPKQPRNEAKAPPKEEPQKEGPSDEQYWTQIGSRLEQLGRKTKAEKASYINENFKIQGNNPTPAEFERFIKELDMEIAEKAALDDGDLE